LISNITKST